MAVLMCPHCGKKVSPNSKKCSHCGAKLKSCPECGALLMKKAEICSSCGYDFERAIDDSIDDIAENSNQEATSEKKRGNDSKNAGKKSESKNICKINRLYDSWAKKDYFIEYKTNMKVLIVFSVLSYAFYVIAGIVAFVTAYNATSISDIETPLIAVMVLAILGTLLSIPEIIINSFVHNYARNSLLAHSKNKKIALKDAILEFNNLYFVEKKDVEEDTCYRAMFAIETLYYENHKNLLKFENFVNVIRIIVKMVLKIATAVLIVKWVVFIGTSASPGTSMERLFTEALPAIITAACCALLSIRFKLAQKFIAVRWVKKEMPAVVDFYRNREYNYPTK